MRVLLLRVLTAVFLLAEMGLAQEQTWRPVAELSQKERARIDLRIHTSRDSQLPYLPAERFPFSPPYTAEEMGLRAMEFPHSPLWNCLIIDINATVTAMGLLDQGVSLTATLYLPQSGFLSHLYHTKPGQEVFRWLSHIVVPPEPVGSHNLFIGYHTGPSFMTKGELVVSIPLSPLLRYRLGHEDRAPNGVGTLEDVVGRNAWEFAWRILGTDVLYETVRFPITRKSIPVPDEKGAPVTVPTNAHPDGQPLSCVHYRRRGFLLCR